MSTTRWSAFVSQHLASGTACDLARRAGIDKATISRWLGGKRPSPESAIAFARALDLSPSDALVHAGYLEPTELERRPGRLLGDLEDSEILTVLASRAAARNPS